MMILKLIAVVVLIRQYLKERGICDKINQYVTLLSEIKLPHNSSPHDLAVTDRELVHDPYELYGPYRIVGISCQ